MAAASTPARDIRVCFVGDSFVAGVGDVQALGWTGRVAAHAGACGVPLTSYNLGVRRDTSRDVLSRLPAELAPRLVGEFEARVVLSFGVNDTTVENGSPRVPAADRRVIVREAIAVTRPIPVLFVGPPPVADAATNRRIAAVDQQIREVCSTLHVPYIEIFDRLRMNAVWSREVAAADGSHPRTAGYQELGTLVRDQLTAWLIEPG